MSHLLNQWDAIEPFVRVTADRETTIKNRFFSTDGHHLLRADRETLKPIAPDDEADLKKSLVREIEKAAVVLLSDYGKGVVTPSFAQMIISLARDSGTPVVVDPKGNDYEHYSGATVITPNRAELA